MSFAGLHTQNYSLYAPLAGWALAPLHPLCSPFPIMAPHFYAIALYNKERVAGTGEWDNTNPRRNRADGIKDAKLSPYQADRFLRAEAANDNSHVNLAIFSSAIVVGNMARLSNSTLNTAAAVYLLSRIAFTYLYINGTSKLMGNLRSVSYLTGVASTFTLFVKAGNKLRYL